MFSKSAAVTSFIIQAAVRFTPTLSQIDTGSCNTQCAESEIDLAAGSSSVDYTRRCTPKDVSNSVASNDNNKLVQADVDCLLCLYKLSAGDATATEESMVRDLCVPAYASNEFEFAKITERGWQFDNEHYAGGGEWNTEIETAAGEDKLAKDAARIDDIFYYEAQRKVITFPFNLTSVNPYTNPSGQSDLHGLHSDSTEERANGASDHFFPDLDGCDINAAYCCFAQDRQAGDNNGNCATPYEYNCVDKDPADNANICYVDHKRSTKANHISGGFSIFGDLVNNKENIEGPVHCHGLVWGDDPLHDDNVYKGNLLFYVSMYDHMTQRGYVRNIPGAPMCACAENMPVVTRSDCTEIAAKETTTFSWDGSSVKASVLIRDLDFNSCNGQNANNNLEERAKQLEEDGVLSAEKRAALQSVLIGSGNGKCNAAIESFLNNNGIQKIA
jgi:hypothetical protein